jgi:hypothetical protein
MEWNGMEWNGMEWNGMECYIIFFMYFINFLRVFRISRSDSLYSRLYFLIERR